MVNTCAPRASKAAETRASVLQDRRQCRPRISVPKPSRAIVGCGDDQPAVRTVRQIHQPPLVSGEYGTDRTICRARQRTDGFGVTGRMIGRSRRSSQPESSGTACKAVKAPAGCCRVRSRDWPGWSGVARVAGPLRARYKGLRQAVQEYGAGGGPKSGSAICASTALSSSTAAGARHAPAGPRSPASSRVSDPPERRGRSRTAPACRCSANSRCG